MALPNHFIVFLSAEKKRFLEDKLRESEMDSEKVDKIIKNSDFLGRKFTKLKVCNPVFIISFTF